MILPKRLLAATACTLLLGLPVLAQEPPAPDENVFVMAGPFSREFFGASFRFWEDHYESNFFAGAGYQRFLYEHPGGFKGGVEAGLGLRLGDRNSVELWGGAVARFDIFSIGDISITPSLTAGLSVVTDTIGEETIRASQISQQVHLLYYLGPEIAIGHAAYPGFEVIGRVHHRSGGFGTIAPIDGSNAAVLGLRYKF